MTGLLGCRIVRAPVPIGVVDLETLVSAADDHRRIAITFIDREVMSALPFYVERVDSLHRHPTLHLPGGCLLDVRPIVLLHLRDDTGGMFADDEHFARYHARTGRGTFIPREIYERLRFDHTPGGVAPIVRTFNEQLLSEQSSHV